MKSGFRLSDKSSLKILILSFILCLPLIRHTKLSCISAFIMKLENNTLDNLVAFRMLSLMIIDARAR